MTAMDGMVVSVGGTPAPVIKAIERESPADVLFVVSGSSRSQVGEQILPALGYVPQYKPLEISDHQNIGTCYREIREGIDRWLNERRLDPVRVYVDITGGTKAMSSALALAAVERFNTLTYVGGDKRSAMDLGVVLDGFEKVVTTGNPLTADAVRELERANLLLEGFHADAAEQTLREASKNCHESHKSRLEAFSSLAQALGESDRFRFNEALKRFNRCCKCLDYSIYKALESLSKRWRVVHDDVNNGGKTPRRRETLLELLANAERRADQARYDDAVGRLYRAVELHGQQLVQQAFGAEMGRVTLDCFPALRRQEVINRLGEPGSDGQYKLGVQKLYRALEFSDDDTLREQAGVYDAVSAQLSDRNTSILAHGFQPVTEKSFKKFWNAALSAMNVSEDEIPRWPTLDLKL